MKAYLQLRLRGVDRLAAARKAGLKRPVTTLYGIERNALTYAGATVWNRAPDPKANPNRDKFRPQSEWVVKEGTHKAIISKEEAEGLLARSLPNPDKKRRERGPSGKFLLTGFLFTPKGAALVSSGDGYYRVAPKGKRVGAAALEAAILAHIGEEIDMDYFLAAFIGELRKAAAALGADPAALRKDVARLSRETSNIVAALRRSPGSVALDAALVELEAEKAEAEERLARTVENAATAKALASTTNAEARRLLDGWRQAPAGDLDERRAALHPTGGADRV